MKVFIPISILFAAETIFACVGTISSLDDVANAVQCTTVNISGFTVPGGQGFELSLLQGSTVNLNGDILFGNMSWSGPLFTVSGKSITFNGNGHTLDGGGPFYWDGQGSNGGTIKPAPMIKIRLSGTYQDVRVLNSPAQVYSVSNPAPLVMTGLTIDNSFGDLPNAQSDGLAAAHNTDGFDASTTNLTIQNSFVHNQDDCIAINHGVNIVFANNTCIGGHGISVGSIGSNVIVSDIVVVGNTILNNDNGIRIKTDASATNSTVTNITYSGNIASGIRKFGVLVDQSYPSTLGTPGSGVIISNINFVISETTIAVNGSAQQVSINCGAGSCTGVWDWSYLSVSGGNNGSVVNFDGISGFTG